MTRRRKHAGEESAPLENTVSPEEEISCAEDTACAQEVSQPSTPHSPRRSGRKRTRAASPSKKVTVLVCALLGAVVLVALCVTAALHFASPRSLPTVPAQQVLWGDTVIGTVPDTSEIVAQYDAWRASQESAQGMALSTASCLSVEPVTVAESYLFSDEAMILALAKDRTPQLYRGVVLQVAGHDMLAFRDQSQAQQVLDTLMDHAKTAILTELSANGTPTTELPEGQMEFAESVQIVERTLTPSDCVSVEQAVEQLSQATGSAQTTYTVAAGDTLAKIASAHQTTQEALLEANPDLESANLIVVGQVLRLRTESRPLNVVTAFTLTREETVPYTTQKKNSSSMNKGTTKVTQEGVNGLSVITARSTYLNGVLSDRETLEETVKKEMVPEIITVGTKVINAYGNPVFPYPVSGYRISSRFGPRNIAVGSSNHKGIDLAVPTGTPVHASADGTVYFSGEATGYGLVVYINHEDGYQTRYAHNSRLVVKKGETVKKGQVIAYAGNTGVSSGPHCHFEIRKDGVAVNPEKYQ